MLDNRTLYEKNVQDRNQLRYLIGLIVRWFVGNKTSNMHEQEELHVSVEPLSEKVSLCL